MIQHWWRWHDRPGQVRMARHFSSPSTPKPPPPPPPVDTSAADQAAAEEKTKARRRKGRSATILTSPMGADLAASQTTQGTKTLGG